MPEYLGRRFGGERIRTYLAVLSLLLSVFTKISVRHTSGLLCHLSIICGADPLLGLMTHVCCSLPRLTSTLGPCSFRCVWAGTCTCPLSSCWWSLLSTLLQVNKRANPRQTRGNVSIFQVRFTHISMLISGGLAAVIYTDTLQTLVMIIGAIILTITGLLFGHFKKNLHLFSGFYSLRLYFPSTAFNKIGGFGNLEHVYSVAVPSKIIPNSTCHLPRQDAMHLFRDAITGDLPWPGMTLGLTILAMWYWCSDQVHLGRHRITYRCRGDFKSLSASVTVLLTRIFGYYFSLRPCFLLHLQ